MNKTNWMHAGYALGLQAVLALGLPPLCTGVNILLGLLGASYALPEIVNAWSIGAAASMAFFISREHAHRQNDIADTTYIPVPQQNPIYGFKGWSLDAKWDAALPCIACPVAALVMGG